MPIDTVYLFRVLTYRRYNNMILWCVCEYQKNRFWFRLCFFFHVAKKHITPITLPRHSRPLFENDTIARPRGTPGLRSSPTTMHINILTFVIQLFQFHESIYTIMSYAIQVNYKFLHESSWQNITYDNSYILYEMCISSYTADKILLCIIIIFHLTFSYIL